MIGATSDKAVSTALDIIKQFCFANNLTIAVAESVSSGILQSLFSSEKEAGLFFEGGITTYNCRQKERHLGIPQATCDPCLGVSEEISKRIASEVCGLFECKFGLGLTGYASPIPEEDVFDLFAFGAIVLRGEVIYCEKIISDKNNPDEIRAEYAKFLVVACSKILQDY